MFFSEEQVSSDLETSLRGPERAIISFIGMKNLISHHLNNHIAYSVDQFVIISRATRCHYELEVYQIKYIRTSN